MNKKINIIEKENEFIDFDVYDQMISVIINDFLLKKGLEVEVILLADYIPVILTEDFEGEEIMFPLFISIDNGPYFNIKGEIVSATYNNLKEKLSEVNKNVRIFNVMINVTSEKEEDSVGYIYTDIQKYYFELPYFVETKCPQTETLGEEQERSER